MAILQIGTAPEVGTGTLEASFRLFTRLVALSCLLAGLQYWGRLIGYSDGGVYRFDLILSYWQLASASLAVPLPVAAVGLWMQVSWGLCSGWWRPVRKSSCTRACRSGSASGLCWSWRMPW